MCIQFQFKCFNDPVDSPNPKLNTIGLHGIARKFDSYTNCNEFLADIDALVRSYSVRYAGKFDWLWMNWQLIWILYSIHSRIIFITIYLWRFSIGDSPYQNQKYSQLYCNVNKIQNFHLSSALGQGSDRSIVGIVSSWRPKHPHVPWMLWILGHRSKWLFHKSLRQATSHRVCQGRRSQIVASKSDVDQWKYGECWILWRTFPGRCSCETLCFVSETTPCCWRQKIFTNNYCPSGKTRHILI